MAKSVDQVWSEMISQEIKKKEPPKNLVAIVLGRMLGLLFSRSFVTGVCLLGVQWMLATALPSVTALQQLIPLWVATLGGLALNTLIIILASSVKDAPKPTVLPDQD